MALAPAPLSVASADLPASRDIHVTATFRPRSPIGSTEVATSLDPLDDTALLTLLDATIARLIAYRDSYRRAMAENDQPATDEGDEGMATVPPPPLALPIPVQIPTPWHAW